MTRTGILLFFAFATAFSIFTLRGLPGISYYGMAVALFLLVRSLVSSQPPKRQTFALLTRIAAVLHLFIDAVSAFAFVLGLGITAADPDFSDLVIALGMIVSTSVAVWALRAVGPIISGKEESGTVGIPPRRGVRGPGLILKILGTLSLMVAAVPGLLIWSGSWDGFVRAFTESEFLVPFFAGVALVAGGIWLDRAGKNSGARSGER